MTLPPDPQAPAQPDLSPRRDVLSVSSLNHMARALLEGNFPAVLVEGEISGFTTPASGHWYLTLKDARAQIRCAMFRGRNLLVRCRPVDGMQVLVKGSLSLYEPRGDYQLLLETLEPAGDGALRRAFEQLKAKLAGEGLFDSTAKQKVSNRFRHVGVITSGTGAAIRDILAVFRRRFPAIRITLIAVPVQGSEAAAEIVRAIGTANRLADRLGLEVLIVGRGGGSLEDLQAFNEEAVARAIHGSRLPVVSAVGHEIDFTIADFVADLRAPTPSAAAELLSPDQQDYLLQLAGLRRKLEAGAERRLSRANQHLASLGARLKHPGRRLLEHAQTLDLLETRLRRGAMGAIRRRQEYLRQLRRNLVAHSPRHRLFALRSATAALRRSAIQAMASLLRQKRDALVPLARQLQAVSPLHVLARGYSITRDADGRVLRKASEAAIGSLIATRLEQGELLSRVIENGTAGGKAGRKLD